MKKSTDEGGTPSGETGEIVLEAGTPSLPEPAANGEELRAAYRRLQLLYELGMAICCNTTLRQLFEEIPGAVSRLTGAERCFVALYDGKGRLTPRVMHGIELPAEVDEWPVSRTLVRRVAEEGVSMVSADAEGDQQLTGHQSLVRLGIRSVMCVPVGSGSSVLGVVYADSRAHLVRYTETDLQFLNALGQYIYLGVKNAREIEQAHAARERSEGCLAQLQQELLSDHQIVGHAPVLLHAYEQLKRAAQKEVPLLLQGETGTGKELFAQAAHNLSPRRGRPFIPVSIAEINPNLIESELFGHERGAFTGAHQKKIGKFELVQGGTLFLDEIAEIPPHLQAKLLRILESREFERVGGQEAIRANFRLICATHQDLEAMVKKGTFREDLYYRIVGVRIPLPPLRERVEDIPELTRHVLRRLKSKKSFTEPALRQLQSYAWPGNVRQFVRVVEAVDALCVTKEATPADLPPPLNPESRGGTDEPGGFALLKEVIAEAEREHIRRALAVAAGNKERARQMLGVSKDTFWKRLKAFDLQ